jgi:hypothetical protein
MRFKSSVSRPCRSTLTERAPSSHRIGGWVGHRAVPTPRYCKGKGKEVMQSHPALRKTYTTMDLTQYAATPLRKPQQRIFIKHF